MTLREIEREILDLIEEDFYGFWEIGWRLRTSLGIDPSVDPEQTAAVIGDLCARNLAEIYVREWDDDSPLPISSAGRRIDVHDPSVWQIPSEGDPQFLLGSPLEAPIDGAVEGGFIRREIP